MNRTQAMKEAVRLFGKGGAARDDGPKRPSSPELRAAAAAKLKAMNAMKATETKEQRKERLDQLYWSGHYRYSVGTVHSMCGLSGFFVKGQGDTWAEAFAAAQDKKAA